jgi:hypothetical protein
MKTATLALASCGMGTASTVTPLARVWSKGVAAGDEAPNERASGETGKVS